MSCVFISDINRNWNDINMERIVILTGGINADFT